MNPPSTIVTPAQVTAASPAAALASSSLKCDRGVTVTALLANTATVYIGDLSVTASTGTELAAGDSIFIEVADVSKVAVFCASGGQKVSVIAQ